MGNTRVKSKAKNRMFIAVRQNTELCDYAVKISIHLSELKKKSKTVGHCKDSV